MFKHNCGKQKCVKTNIKGIMWENEKFLNDFSKLHFKSELKATLWASVTYVICFVKPKNVVEETVLERCY